MENWVLAVDDDTSNLRMASRILSGGKMRVSCLRSGEEALGFLTKSRPDLILLDINMPDMNGFEVFGKIKLMEELRSIPVIFLTADNDPETESRCLNEGAVDFIAKPFVPAVMLSRVSRALELEKLRRGLAEKLEQKTKEISDIKSRSDKDVLTGLWNRAYTEEAVNILIQQEVKGALMMIDMDNFKAINDTYGHIAGDRTLKMFADTLREFSAPGDILCRIGGDEFVVFIKDASSKEELGKRAGDIISDLTRKLDECKFETRSSVSVGIAQTPEDGTDFAKLYNSADKALYYVKQNGKSSYHFFSDRLQPEISLGETTADLEQLRDLMNRSDNGRGAYFLDFDSFHRVYNFIRRFAGRSRRRVQMILFTVIDNDPSALDVSETETALEVLENTVRVSLRSSDASTRYSSRQIVAILMDADSSEGEIAARRIIDSFYSVYSGKGVRVDYGIVDVGEKSDTKPE